MRNVHAIKKNMHTHTYYMISMSRPIYVDSRSANKNETKYPGYWETNSLSLAVIAVHGIGTGTIIHWADILMCGYDIYVVFICSVTLTLLITIFSLTICTLTHTQTQWDRQNKTDIRRKNTGKNQTMPFQRRCWNYFQQQVYFFSFGSFVRSFGLF